jgi:hypothetical protein
VGTEIMTDCSSDLVVKEQVVLKQMLVCYESILTAESSALSLIGIHTIWKSQSPHPFGLAQGRLCRRERDKGRVPAGVEMRKRGQPL